MTPGNGTSAAADQSVRPGEGRTLEIDGCNGRPRRRFIPSTLFPQHEDRLVALHHESLDVIKPGLQKVRDLTSRGVSEADLNDLWGMASHQSTGQKVVVFREDREPFVFRQPPDALVVVASKLDITNVTTSGKARRLTPSPNPEPVLVKESSSPGWGLKGFSHEEATQCRADCWLASAG